MARQGRWLENSATSWQFQNTCHKLQQTRVHVSWLPFHGHSVRSYRATVPTATAARVDRSPSAFLRRVRCLLTGS